MCYSSVKLLMEHQLCDVALVEPRKPTAHLYVCFVAAAVQPTVHNNNRN